MREINLKLKLSMFNGDNYTTKHMYAWGDQYVTKPRLNLSISEGVKYCFHNNFFKKNQFAVCYSLI